MPQESIKQILMRRDNMSEEDANQLIQDAQDDLFHRLETNDCTADEICADWFGLEPDYIDELLY